MSKDVSKEDVSDSSKPDDAVESPSGEPSRRGFAIASVVLGALVSLGPSLIGLFAFLDPLWRIVKKPKAYEEPGGGSGDGFIRVASVDSLSDTPQRFPVIDDQIDAWNFTPDQPIGAVYIQKPAAGGSIRVFNTTCPHAGCSVSCVGETFECPCHNSAFNLDGTKRTSGAGRPNPSPRDLDKLKFEERDGAIWIEFKNFYTGRHEMKEKA